MKDRISQVNSLLRDELAKFISEFLEVPLGTLVTIVRVEASVDLYYATVYISVLPKENEEKILSKINRFIRGIQSHLNHRLEMKYVPQLRFRIDHTEEKQAEFERVLDEVKGSETPENKDEA